MPDPRRGYAFVLCWPVAAVGGVNEVVKNLLHEFRAAGDFHPILLESDWRRKRPLIDRRPDYTHVRLRLRGLSPDPGSSFKGTLMYLLTLPWTLWTLARLARELRIATFNVHYPELDALRWIALRALGLFRGPVILSFHGTDIRTAYGMRGWRRGGFRLLLRRADAIVACSAGLLGEIRGLEARLRGYVIHNGIDVPRFEQEGREHAATVPLPEGDRILSIGKFQFGKGHDILVRAFARLFAMRPTARLVLVGSTGPELDRTRALVQDAGLSEVVSFLCDVPHGAIPYLLKSSRMLVLSSRWVPGRLGEGLPMVLLEAGAMGTPIVTTRTCGADEIVSDGVTGRLVPLEDPESLAAAMRDMLDDHVNASAMAKTLVRRVREEFTWHRAYTAYLGLLTRP